MRPSDVIRSGFVRRCVIDKEKNSEVGSQNSEKVFAIVQSVIYIKVEEHSDSIFRIPRLLTSLNSVVF